MHRHDLSDEEWGKIQRYLPSDEHHEGHPWGDHRQFLNGMIWHLATGAAWRDLPERYGKWNSIFRRFNRWSKQGLMQKIATSLQKELESRGRIEWDLWCIDSTIIQAGKPAAGALKKNHLTKRAPRLRSGRGSQRV